METVDKKRGLVFSNGSLYLFRAKRVQMWRPAWKYESRVFNQQRVCWIISGARSLLKLKFWVWWNCLQKNFNIFINQLTSLKIRNEIYWHGLSQQRFCWTLFEPYGFLKFKFRVWWNPIKHFIILLKNCCLSVFEAMAWVLQRVVREIKVCSSSRGAYQRL